MGFSRQEYWSGLPFSSPGDLPDPGIEPGSSAFQADSLPSEPPGKPKEKLDFIKIKNFCSSKDTFKKVKRSSREWENIFVNYISDKSLKSECESHVLLFATPWTWDFPGKNTVLGCHFFLQGILTTQGSNLGLLHSRQILYHLSHQGSPVKAWNVLYIKNSYNLTIKRQKSLFKMGKIWIDTCHKKIYKWPVNK